MIELGARMPFYLGKLPQRDLVADTYESDEPEFDEDTRQEGEAVEEERLESAVQEGVHEEDAEAAERTPETADVPVMEAAIGGDELIAKRCKIVRKVFCIYIV